MIENSKEKTTFGAALDRTEAKKRYADLRNELSAFNCRIARENDDGTVENSGPFKRKKILDSLDRDFSGHENDNPYELKAYQYRKIADEFEPVIFSDSPFCFELATKYSFSDGTAYARGEHPGGWTLLHNLSILNENNSDDFKMFEKRKNAKLYCICGPRVELMHYGFPYEAVIENGLSGIYATAEKTLERAETDEERSFIGGCMAGLLSLKRIAESFSEKAKELLSSETDETRKKFLGMISESAAAVPWEKPRSFYEGLNAIALLRESVASLEGIGISCLGRPDKYLAKLYKNDIANGKLTFEEAYDLICRFLLIWDCKHNRDKEFHGGAEHELECTLNFGGTDDEGKPFANEITKLFLMAYADLDCIYPKFQCRCSAESPRWYLDMISADICAGRANYLIANDDELIPALIRSGKEPQDAEKYVVSGCWDIFCDGIEHRPGGEYLNLIRPLEWSLYGADTKDLLGYDSHELGIDADSLTGKESFEELYKCVLGNIDKLVSVKVADNNRGLSLFSKAAPMPLYSACMSEPLNRLKDITNNGAKYSPGSIYYVAFANLADSLMALKRVCFETGKYSLEEVTEALKANWEGAEEIRTELMKSPYYCDGSRESEEFCRKLQKDLCDIASKYRTIWGDKYDVAYLVYVEFLWWGAASRATPDGRHNGDMFSHGIGPARNHTIEYVTDIANAISALDLGSVNSIANLVFPCGKVNTEIMTDFIITLCKLGLQSIHLNCVNVEELREAQIHPEGKDHIIVRICGFSAKFISLDRRWQDEFISRNMLG